MNPRQAIRKIQQLCEDARFELHQEDDAALSCLDDLLDVLATHLPLPNPVSEPDDDDLQLDFDDGA